MPRYEVDYVTAVKETGSLFVEAESVEDAETYTKEYAAEDVYPGESISVEIITVREVVN